VTKARGKVVVFVLLAALAVVALWRGFGAPAMPMDEGLLLVYPELLLKESAGRTRLHAAIRFENGRGEDRRLVSRASMALRGP
jgi:hypothetical protein